MDSRMRSELDRWITGGRFQSVPALFSCPWCKHTWSGSVDTEYGASEYLPHDSCPACDTDLNDGDWTPDEGPDEDA